MGPQGAVERLEQRPRGLQPGQGGLGDGPVLGLRAERRALVDDDDTDEVRAGRQRARWKRSGSSSCRRSAVSMAVRAASASPRVDANNARPAAAVAWA